MLERNYNQNCGIARASDLLGERWTLLVVRDLLIAPRRFGELEARMKGMGTNLLAKRLKDMHTAGLIAGGQARSPYRLTEMGRALEPMMLDIIRWSVDWLRGALSPDGLHFPEWDLLALKALFVPDPKMRRRLLARFEAGDWVAWISVDRQNYAFGLGEPEQAPDIFFPCKISALRVPDRIISGMNVKMRTKARQLLGCFPFE